jgi:hypothetical protein
LPRSERRSGSGSSTGQGIDGLLLLRQASRERLLVGLGHLVAPIAAPVESDAAHPKRPYEKPIFNTEENLKPHKMPKLKMGFSYGRLGCAASLSTGAAIGAGASTAGAVDHGRCSCDTGRAPQDLGINCPGCRCARAYCRPRRKLAGSASSSVLGILWGFKFSSVLKMGFSYGRLGNLETCSYPPGVDPEGARFLGHHGRCSCDTGRAPQDLGINCPGCRQGSGLLRGRLREDSCRFPG